MITQEADSDSFENWENLIKACETLDGGLNRNSSPQALATFRDAYDRFLFKFPLLFGYWKKYADLEFNIAGPESAQMVCLHRCETSRTATANRSAAGVRKRMRQHHQFCRLVGRVLLLYHGDYA